MGTENRYKMSQESLDKLKEELDYLETVRPNEV
ncbi:MAG: transcription elongation factor GreA, partial [Ruminococcaceae bacterium]|nr:transcription elongation factor GreA [Oscillospiraceae bacterium]